MKFRRTIAAAALAVGITVIPLASASASCTHPVLKCQSGNFGIAKCRIVYVPGC